MRNPVCNREKRIKMQWCFSKLHRPSSALPSLASLITSQQQPHELRCMKYLQQHLMITLAVTNIIAAAPQGRSDPPAQRTQALQAARGGGRSAPQPNVLPFGNFPPSLPPSLPGATLPAPSVPAARPAPPGGALRPRLERSRGWDRERGWEKGWEKGWERGWEWGWEKEWEKRWERDWERSAGGTESGTMRGTENGTGSEP